MTDILIGFSKSGIVRKIYKNEWFLNSKGLPQLEVIDCGYVAEVLYPQYMKV